MPLLWFKNQENTYNTSLVLLSLPGNIRVFCRVRPCLPTDPGYLRDSTGRESSLSGGSSGSSKSVGNSQRTLSITYPDGNGDRKKLSLELAQEKVTNADWLSATSMDIVQCLYR